MLDTTHHSVISGDFYPEIEPYNSGSLPLDGLHSMYWEQSGNPDGVPALFLHGGPGAGAGPKHRRFFDPAFYRIIVFDQRGAGRSTPLGELSDNTTPHLIGDIERLREHLGIERWLVFGGSWGSTLALAYAEHHPNRCLGLVLRGIFLCRPSEIEWFLWHQRNIFPEAWRKLVAPLAAAERADYRAILAAYHTRLIHPDPAVHLPAAHTWSVYEGSCSTLLLDPDLIAHFDSDVVALGLARIEAHYFMHEIFLPENFLLDNIGAIRHLPTVIVQGRYDGVCPIVSADALTQAWPEAEYHIIDDAGHSAFEPGIRKALIEATDRFKRYALIKP